MSDVYQPCPCGSGKKLKFCCFEKAKSLNHADPRTLVHRSAEFKIHECLISENWQEGGLANALVVRAMPNGKYLFASYLVDVFCLGLKDTICNANVSRVVAEGVKGQLPQVMVPSDYEDVRSVVLGAIEYAHGFGFEPNPDWTDAQFVIEPHRDFARKYEFGQDGKPFYIQGPHDDPIAVMARLGTRVQQGTADFLLEASEEGPGLTQGLMARFRRALGNL